MQTTARTIVTMKRIEYIREAIYPAGVAADMGLKTKSFTPMAPITIATTSLNTYRNNG